MKKALRYFGALFVFNSVVSLFSPDAILELEILGI